MILSNIETLINITEEVAYQDSEIEFTRNLKGLAEFVKNTVNPTVLSPSDCCCNPMGDPYQTSQPEEQSVAIQASMPAKLAGYGPGIASTIANKMANSVRYDVSR